MLLTNRQAMDKMTEDFPFSANYEIVKMRDIPDDHPSPYIFRYVKEVNKKGNLTFTFNEVNGVMRGDYEIGKQITNMRQYEEVSKDWMVIRHAADIGATLHGVMPPMDHPIAAMIEGRAKPVIGILAKETYSGGIRHTTFMELIGYDVRDEDYYVHLSCDTVTSRGDRHINKPRRFKSIDINTVMAWSFVDDNGYLIPFKKPNHPVKDIFLDCEFDDTTKTLISVGVAIGDKLYYAYDKRVIPDIKNEWVLANVIPILESYPSNTMAFDLESMNMTFQKFISGSLAMELQLNGSENINIHVDFPTDVAYIAPLFHLGEGKRIGNMPKLQFHVDYVDPYPTTMESAVQHNAAWDALVLRHHLGFGPK